MAAQTAEADSLLNFYKQLLALRRESTALTRGEFKLLTNMPRDVLGYLRIADNEQMLVLLNFGDADQVIHLPASSLRWQVCLSSKSRRAAEHLAANITLARSEALILT